MKLSLQIASKVGVITTTVLCLFASSADACNSPAFAGRSARAKQLSATLQSLDRAMSAQQNITSGARDKDDKDSNDHRSSIVGTWIVDWYVGTQPSCMIDRSNSILRMATN